MHSFEVHSNSTACRKNVRLGLEQVNTLMQNEYNTNQPIETLFEQVKDAVTLAAAGQAPYYNAHIVEIAYILIFNT